MNINPIVLSIPVFFVLIGIELLFEHFSRKKNYRLPDALSNLSCGITQQVSGVFLKLFGIGLYVLVYEYLRIWQIPSNAYSFALLFILVDLAYYWAHRMSHEINLFWSAHVVHHQSEDYNLTVALRQSSLQVLWTSVFYLPLALAGFDPFDFLLAAAFTTLYQFWVHTQHIGRLGWLEYLLVTPSLHRVHHGRDPKYIDKNHGGVFIIWDMLFGSYQKEEEPPVYGITTPLHSWDPIRANFSHLALMWKELRQIPRWSDRLRYLFYKPGWLPDYMGGYRPPPAVNRKEYSKFDTPVPKKIKIYVLLQYPLLTGLAAGFLYYEGSLDMPVKVGIALLIAFAVLSIGRLLERQPHAGRVELLRLAAFALMAAWLGLAGDWPPVVFYAGAAYSLLSALMIFFILRAEKKERLTDGYFFREEESRKA